MRSAANVALADFTRNQYFDSLPISEIYDLLKGYGIYWEESEGIYTGREGRISEDLYDADGQMYSNANLVMTWHKMPESGRYEVVAYVS